MIRTLACILIGGVAGWLAYYSRDNLGGFLCWLANCWRDISKAWPAGPYILRGAACGLAIGSFLFLRAILWPALRRTWSWLGVNGWRITEANVAAFGQELKITSTSSQRRAAWMLCVDLATRIVVRDMHDDYGDNGDALGSLYSFFQSARKTLSDTSPRPGVDGETVESYVIRVLNRDLAPFLSAWHPQWDAWRKANPNAPSIEWAYHKAFRDELRELQKKAHQIAAGLAKIAGYNDAEQRLFGKSGET